MCNLPLSPSGDRKYDGYSSLSLELELSNGATAKRLNANNKDITLDQNHRGGRDQGQTSLVNDEICKPNRRTEQKVFCGCQTRVGAGRKQVQEGMLSGRREGGV